MANIPKIIISPAEEPNFNTKNNHKEETTNSSFSNEMKTSHPDSQHFMDDKPRRKKKHKRSRNRKTNVPKVIITSESDDEKDHMNDDSYDRFHRRIPS